MENYNESRPVVAECFNCHHKQVALRTPDGLTKMKCGYCGAVSVSKVKSRRHLQVDIYAPKGQVLLQTINN